MSVNNNSKTNKLSNFEGKICFCFTPLGAFPVAVDYNVNEISRKTFMVSDSIKKHKINFTTYDSYSITFRYVTCADKLGNML